MSFIPVATIIDDYDCEFVDGVAVKSSIMNRIGEWMFGSSTMEPAAEQEYRVYQYETTRERFIVVNRVYYALQPRYESTHVEYLLVERVPINRLPFGSQFRYTGESVKIELRGLTAVRV
jgi:hypothetical protein